MGVKSILAAGSVSFVVFLLLAYAYGFVKAGDAQAELKEISASFGTYVPDLAQAPQMVEQNKPLIAFGELYLLVMRGGFTSLGNTINTAPQLIQNTVTQMLGQFGGFASMFAGGIQQAVGDLFNAVLPNPLFFYLFAIIAGFVAGLIFLRNAPLKTVALSPILPALLLAILVFAVSVIFLNPMLSQAGGAAGLPAGITVPSIGISDAVLVFIVSYVCFAVGAFIPTGLLRLKARGGGQAAPAPAAKPAAKPMAKTAAKVAPKKASKASADEEEDEE